MRELRWWLPGLLLGLLWMGVQQWRQKAASEERAYELGRSVASLAAPALYAGEPVSLAYLEPLGGVSRVQVTDAQGQVRGRMERPLPVGVACQVPVISGGQLLGAVAVSLVPEPAPVTASFLAWIVLAGFVLRGLARRPAALAVPRAAVPRPAAGRTSSGGFSRLLMLLQSGKPSRRLRELETHYRELCDNARDFIVLINSDGAILYANRAWRAGLGLPVGLRIWDFGPDSEQPMLRAGIEHVVRGEAPELLRLQLQAPTGQRVPAEGHFSPSQADSSQLILLGVFRDLSERLRAEKELQQAEERFRQAQKMDAVGRLAGGVAHDFNNLLTVMSTVNTLIRMEVGEGSSLEELLTDSDEACARAARLTRQLLVFSRRRVVSHERLLLDEAADELLKLARRVVGEDVTLQVNLRSQAWVEADHGELDQVLMNLLVNARDALEGGGGEIHFCTRATSATAQIIVRDTGCGIPPDVRERIFEPYFTTKPTGRGTGLGLSTVFAIVESMQGRIDVSSEVGQGTTFTITLPLARTVVALPTGLAPLEDGTTDGTETILLVEDERPVCQTVARSLRARGYRVLDYTDPLEALRRAPLEQVDLLLSDLIMPGLSGAELASRFRERRPDLKVLFVSGYPGDTLERHDLRACGGFLAKPFDLDQLARSVRRQLAA